MQEMVFGYDEVKGLQAMTTRSIPGRLKDFCDRVILEWKIPNRFDQVQAFANGYQELLKQVNPLEQLLAHPGRVVGAGGGRVVRWAVAGTAHLR
jgi:hypothetical protein